ncbi:Arc family DNA-binding protein [Escherichia coli]|nr:Arc family DNA-binding protein [Escherichia coli]
MGRDDPQFNLRLPYELKEKLRKVRISGEILLG